MKISNADWASGQVPDSRRPGGRARAPRGPAVPEQGAQEARPPEEAAHAQLRQRVLELQRSATALQRALAGLEGFRTLLDGPGAGSPQGAHEGAEQYIRANRRLAPYADRLRESLQRGGGDPLEGMIAEVTDALRAQAVELGRIQTALQNSQALGGPADQLAAAVRAVRGAGEELLQTDGKSVLELLG